MIKAKNLPSSPRHTRLFDLVRTEDVSGVSGTGLVGIGVQFPNGQVVMQWQGALTSLVIYKSIQDVRKIHGHGGRTQVIWRD
jgi:hypothetical protein